jgi:hypothetical protein
VPQLDLRHHSDETRFPSAPLFPAGRPRRALILRIVGIHAIGIALLVFVFLHFTSGGLRHH